MIIIEVDSRSVIDALSQLQRRISDLKPVMQDIGEHLSETTKRRFGTSTGPDGQRWAPNSQVTILQYLGRYGGSYGKSGKLTSKGAGRVIGKKPLIGETKSLFSTIHYQAGADYVEVGSPMEYAAMHQFGGAKTDFSNLWGDIPARPFLGVSDEDERYILDIISGYIGR